jgi:hypothetical protein
MNGVGVLSQSRVRTALVAAGLVVTTAFGLSGTASAHQFGPPVRLDLRPPATVVLDGRQLVRNQMGLLTGDRTLKTSLTDLLAQADAALTAGPWSVTGKTQLPPSGDVHDYLSLAPYYWPTQPITASNPWGCPMVNRDGQRDPLVDAVPDHQSEIAAFADIYNLTLAWYYTGEQQYARRAELDLRTWFTDPATAQNPNLAFAQGIPCQVTGRGIGIIEFSYALTEVVDSTAILDDGAPGWTRADHAAVKAWDSAFLTWLRTNSNGASEAAQTNNHGTFYDMMSAALALYTGQRGLARTIVQGAETNRIAKQILPTGQQPLETARTLSYHYSNFNLVALTRLAQIGQHVGVDVWHYTAPNGGSLLKAVDFMIPPATHGNLPSVWPYQDLTFFQYAALDVLHAAANAGDRNARAALPMVPVEPGGDLFPLRPAAEQLDNVATTPPPTPGG